MENKKYEQLIDLIINEQEEKARELFHEIVVEKSREIYESIMDEEVMEADDKDDEEKVEESAEDDDADAIEESMEDGMEEGQPAGQVMDMLDEISAEEAGGMTEEEDDIEVDAEMDVDSEGEEVSVDKDELEDIKDKLDDLMAEFEAIMSGDAHSDEEEMLDISSDEEGVEGDEEEALAEAVQLKKVPGLYGSKIGGDDGSNAKSPTLTAPKVKTAGVNPVKFSGHSEAVPTGPKAPSNYGTKGEKEVPGAGNFKNSPGKDNFKEKGESATKPHLAQASGVNTKSPVAKG